MRIFVSSAIFSLLLSSIGCAVFSRAKSERDPANDQTRGYFHLLTDISSEKLPQGWDPQIVLRSSQFVGALFMDRELVLDEEKVKKAKYEYCGSSTAVNFEEPYCQKISSTECTHGCKVTIARMRCTGIRIGKYFVTNKHCAPEKGNLLNPQVKFSIDQKTTRTFKLRRTKFTYHNEPFDISIFEIVGKFSSETSLRDYDPEKGETVYGVGFPYLASRKQANESYQTENGRLRVTFGEVTAPNKERKSFCEYTNEDNVTDVEKWTLTDNCKNTDYTSLKFSAREERDVFLTNTDMTWGMSGSPLFDQGGSFLGIGSNILSNDPREYDPHKNAIYVKAANIIGLIHKLK